MTAFSTPIWDDTAREWVGESEPAIHAGGHQTAGSSRAPGATARLLPDWPMPAGCSCFRLSDARACYERCDDTLIEPSSFDIDLSVWVFLALFAVVPTLFVFLVIKFLE